MSITTNTDYGSNGQYVLNKLSLFAKTGEKDSDEEIEWNLIPSFIECSLFESLFDQTMSGYVSVLDSLNVSDFLPLYGGERIEIEFHTAGAQDNPIVYHGVVYKVSERSQVTEQTSGYIIRFCSEAALRSERVFVQAGFEDTSDIIVKEIYDRYLVNPDAPEERIKPLATLPSQHIQFLSFGFIHPLDAISIAIRGSRAINDTSGYIFYENNKEFRLDTLQALYAQEPIAQYSSIHRGMFDNVKDRAIETFERVQAISFDEENSLLDRLQDGIHGSDHVFFDLITKQVVTHHYRKEDFFDPEKSLGNKPNKKEAGFGTDATYLSYVNGSIDWSLDRVLNRMVRIQSETIRANITVFGDSNLKAGDVLNVYFPRMNNDPEKVSISIEGKVLISAIRHTFSKQSYMQEIEIIKDSYNEDAIASHTEEVL